MKLTITEAKELAVAVLRVHGVPAEDAEITADHLVDAHLAGHTFAGLPRLLVILERIRSEPAAPARPIEVAHQTPVSATIDGHNHLGYVVCRRAADVAIEKAAATGVAVVGAFNSYYSGRSGYYTERAARSGFVAVHASSAFPMVAPTGGSERVLGTNPFAVAFPAPGHPVSVDMSTASITWGEIQMATVTGEPLPDGVAIDQDGSVTTDATAALLGAVLPWGGHKGYALGVMVQLLGVLAGGDALPEPFGNFGFFFIVVRPDLLVPRKDYDRRVDELIARLRACRPSPGSGGVLVPGDRSASRRAEQLAEGMINIPDAVHAELSDLIAAARG